LCAVLLPVALLLASALANASHPKDREAVGQAFRAADRDEWSRAFRLIDEVEDPLATKTLRWLRMINQERPADFATLAGFLMANPGWPMAERLQAIAEDTITDPADHALIRKFFESRPPLTTRGHIRYAQALFAAGEDERGAELIRRAWVEGDFSAREDRRFYQKYRRLLTREDHIARLDNLLGDYRRTSARRMIERVPAGYRQLAEARMRLQRRQNGLDEAIEAVPAELRGDPGLTFDRLRWRRQKARHGDVIDLLLDPPAELRRPQLWWFERELQIRRALRKRDFDLAFRLASRHGQKEGESFAEAEWLAGWLALRFADQPGTAFRHFVRMRDGVSGPISQSRAAYWAGRAAAMQGDQALAGRWYREAAHHHITYYGQQALEELGADPGPLPAIPAATATERATFEGKELVRVARMLIDAGAPDRQLSLFLIQLAGEAASPVEVGLVAELAASSGLPHLVTQVGRHAAYYGQVNEAAAFPIPEIDRMLRPPAGDPEPALLLGVARQESIFNTWGVSRAGARGLLQLMPRTAFLMAKSIGLPYNSGLLTGDPDYNVRLGSHYLKTLLQRYEGETALAAAAYNAGPTRVEEWLRLHGDPRRGDRHAIIDWIELIPFAETRNYVQRVLEGRNLYRRRLAGPELATVWFRPVRGPLEPLPSPRLKSPELARQATADTLATAAPLPARKPGAREVAPSTVALPPARPDLPEEANAAPMPQAKPSLDDEDIEMAAAGHAGVPYPVLKPEREPAS
jgi:soluble lytic murein transglycosylase